MLQTDEAAQQAGVGEAQVVGEGGRVAARQLGGLEHPGVGEVVVPLGLEVPHWRARHARRGRAARGGAGDDARH